MQLLKLVRFMGVLFCLTLAVSCNSGSNTTIDNPPAPSFSSFTLQNVANGQTYSGFISQANHQIIVVVPSNVSESMIATFSTQNTNLVSIGEIIQESGVTINNFVNESSLVYTLVGNGITQNYTVMRLEPIRGSLTQIGNESIPSGGAYPSSMAIDSHVRYAYVANNNSIISMFHIESVGESAGILTPFSPESYIIAGHGSFAVVLTSDDKFAYVSNGSDNTISMFKVESVGESAGVLVPLTPESTVTTGAVPNQIVISAANQYLYVLNSESESISMFRIESAGESAGILVPLATPSISFDQRYAISMAITPIIHGEQYIYTSGINSTNINMFKIESSGNLKGQLTPLNPQTLTTGSSFSIIVAPNGNFAYMTDLLSGKVLMFSINQDSNSGELALLSPASIQLESQLGRITMTPNGQFAYVVNAFNNTISLLGANAVSGMLSAISQSYPVFNSINVYRPSVPVVTPNGKFLYVLSTAPDVIWMFKIN